MSNRCLKITIPNGTPGFLPLYFSWLFSSQLKATPSFGEICSPKTLESSIFFSFILHVQSIRKFHWFYLPHISIILSLHMTSPWPPCSEPPSSLTWPIAIASLWLFYLLPLLPCGHCQRSKQTDILECKVMALLCFSGFSFYVNGKL